MSQNTASNRRTKMPPIKDVGLASQSCLSKLADLLGEDLDFHHQESGYASHNFHAFPAKFPPQLPRKFILALTSVGDVVLDPMTGSGTTLLEAFLLGRRGIGFDIDPLALLLTKTKTATLDLQQLHATGQAILKNARQAVSKQGKILKAAQSNIWSSQTSDFVDYWFTEEVQVELQALIEAIRQIPQITVRAFFELAFSAIIITKSGGVSLALDLAHTRPHRAKIIFDQTGQLITGRELIDVDTRRSRFMRKNLRSPFEEFEKRVAQNLKGLPQSVANQRQLCLFNRHDRNFEMHPQWLPVCVARGDAQHLPMAADSVDLIVTSPPYASNAIDYMRAHKFSLVWLGYSIDELKQKRKDCIGGETVTAFAFEPLPAFTADIVTAVSRKNVKKGRVLHRYYSEMTRVLREIQRVLKPGASAVLVVGNSILGGQDTQTQNCLADIGKNIGLQVPGIGMRNLDRNRRMMPAGMQTNLDSQIQQRMHVEYVIGFHKPDIHTLTGKEPCS